MTVELTWVGGPDDGLVVAVPYEITTLVVRLVRLPGPRHVFMPQPLEVTRISFPVRDNKIIYYEGVELK